MLMCVDHMGLALFPAVGAFRCVGRLSFPLYCFLLTQGFLHTRDVRAYARRLLLLALVSEAPFDLLIFGRLSSGAEQNAVFALLLSLLALHAARTLAASPGRRAVALLAVATAMAARVSYGWLGPALCLGFYAAGSSRAKRALCAAALPLAYSLSLLLSGVDRGWVLVSLCACASALPILLYNGRRGPRVPALSFLFYAAYPLHIAALLIVRALRIIPPYFLG